MIGVCQLIKLKLPETGYQLDLLFRHIPDRYSKLRWLARDLATGYRTPNVLERHTKAPPALLPGETVALHLPEAQVQVGEIEIDTTRAVVDTMMKILNVPNGDPERMTILVGIGNEARGVAGMMMIGTARAVGMMSGIEIEDPRDGMRTIGTVHLGIKAEIARGRERGIAMNARRRIEG